MKLIIPRFIHIFHRDAVIYMVLTAFTAFISVMCIELEVPKMLIILCSVLTFASFVCGCFIMFCHVMLVNSIDEGDFIEAKNILHGFEIGRCHVHDNRLTFFNKEKKKIITLRSCVVRYAVFIATE